MGQDAGRVGQSGPRLLYLSPVVPAASGNGLAMRAGMVLRALARRSRVSLLVVTLYASPARTLPPELARCCRQVVVARPDEMVPSPMLARASGCGEPGGGAGKGLCDEPFDIVHVFRLAMLPYARPWLDRPGPAPRRHLDLDDLESITRRRIAALYRANGEEAGARVEEGQAAAAERLEAEVLREFDRVYVCSEVDRRALLGRGRAELCVLPNALPIPPPLGPKRDDGPFTFLFVGTLGYYPNEDGILYFCREVLPLIRRGAEREFRINVVGTGATPALRELDGVPEARLIGSVPDVAPWYRDADAVVVPIRAGGGTRIKVLEAFAHGRPVVSTTIGIEGIEARAEEHVLVGDAPIALAEQCLRLMAEGGLAERLSERAFSLFARAYTPEVVASSLVLS